MAALNVDIPTADIPASTVHVERRQMDRRIVARHTWHSVVIVLVCFFNKKPNKKRMWKFRPNVDSYLLLKIGYLIHRKNSLKSSTKLDSPEV